jgi:hypothetical protein
MGAIAFPVFNFITGIEMFLPKGKIFFGPQIPCVIDGRAPD